MDGRLRFVITVMDARQVRAAVVAALSTESGDARVALRLSVIVPVLDEAAALRHRRTRLRALRRTVHELIIVDGGSRDGTLELSRSLAGICCSSRAGRAHQMNEGARRASGEVLLFLHADTSLPEDAPRRLSNAFANRDAVWGRFDVRLSGSHWFLRVVETAMNCRSRLTGIATGDQAMFVRRSVFEQVGGFPSMALMEDVALSRTLLRIQKPLCLRERVVTSSRRWLRHGFLRTIFLMWGLRLAYALGADPGRLHRIYYRR